MRVVHIVFQRKRKKKQQWKINKEKNNGNCRGEYKKKTWVLIFWLLLVFFFFGCTFLCEIYRFSTTNFSASPKLCLKRTKKFELIFLLLRIFVWRFSRVEVEWNRSICVRNRRNKTKSFASRKMSKQIWWRVFFFMKWTTSRSLELSGSTQKLLGEICKWCKRLVFYDWCRTKTALFYHQRNTLEAIWVKGAK